MHFVFNILHEKTLSVINAIEKRHKQTPLPPKKKNKKKRQIDISRGKLGMDASPKRR